MSECDEFLKTAIDADSVEGAGLQEHAAHCSRCREQLLIDGGLRRLFQGIARPAPSPHFNRVLRQRLLADGERQRRRRWRLALMEAYWVAAGVIAIAVVMRIRWPGEVPSVPVLCSLGAVLGVALLTVVALLRSLRITPRGILVDTMGAFRR